MRAPDERADGACFRPFHVTQGSPMETLPHMTRTARRARWLCVAMLVLAAFNLADWLYSGLGEIGRLLVALGFLLFAGYVFVDARRDSADAPAWSGALLAGGLVLTAAGYVMRWS